MAPVGLILLKIVLEMEFETLDRVFKVPLKDLLVSASAKQPIQFGRDAMIETLDRARRSAAASALGNPDNRLPPPRLGLSLNHRLNDRVLNFASLCPRTVRVVPPCVLRSVPRLRKNVRWASANRLFLRLKDSENDLGADWLWRFRAVEP